MIMMMNMTTMTITQTWKGCHLCLEVVEAQVAELSRCLCSTDWKHHNHYHHQWINCLIMINDVYLTQQTANIIIIIIIISENIVSAQLAMFWSDHDFAINLATICYPKQPQADEEENDIRNGGKGKLCCWRWRDCHNSSYGEMRCRVWAGGPENIFRGYKICSSSLDGKEIEYRTYQRRKKFFWRGKNFFTLLRLSCCVWECGPGTYSKGTNMFRVFSMEKELFSEQEI